MALIKARSRGINLADTFAFSGTVSGAGGGITEADQWRMYDDLAVTGNTSTVITSNLERVDTRGFGKLGTGMSESSGVFTFPSTGVWQITFVMWVRATGGSIEMVGAKIQTCTDGSSFDDAANNYENVHASNAYGNSSPTFIFDVTNTSTHKVKFAFRHGGACTFQGSTNTNYSHMTFVRLGDT
tara:strand:- start:1 stop:552 length:552 start_codon:yes stop_codon:yes gene_type:complete